MDIKEIERIVRKEIVDHLFQIQDFIVVGNWKMNHTKNEVITFLDEISNHDFGKKNTVVIVPPSPYLSIFEEKLRYSSVYYGAQNFYPRDSGAFTGEISIKMIQDFGCKYALVGHSERRNIFYECNAFASKKVEACIKNKIQPILCIGENLDQRKLGEYKQLLGNQLKEGLVRVTGNELLNVIIAYEPIWAIGTGETATPDQVEEVHIFIRKYLVDAYGIEIGSKIPILYGGSVNPSNVKELALAQNVSGFLIGGASLKAQSFIEINDILNGK